MNLDRVQIFTSESRVRCVRTSTLDVEYQTMLLEWMQKHDIPPLIVPFSVMGAECPSRCVKATDWFTFASQLCKGG